MKRNHIVDLVIFFITSISLQNVNCDGQLSSKQNSKLNLKIAVLLPLLEGKPKSHSSRPECSDTLRPDALQTVTALYYALDLIERDETLSKNFTLTLDVIENCNDSVLEMRHLSNLIERLQEPIGAENATAGVIYSNDFAELQYETIFQSFPNFPLISCSGPPIGIADVNEIKRHLFHGFITVTSRHIFIVDVVFEILKQYNWKYITIYSPACDDDMAAFFKKRAHELARSDEVCIGHSTNPIDCLISLLRGTNYLTVKNKPTYDTVDVIICYCGIQDIENLKNELQNRGKKYLVIAGNIAKPWKDGKVTWTSDIGELYYVTPTQQYNEKLYHFYRSVKNDTKYAYFKEFRERYHKKKFHSENTTATEETSISSDTFRDIYNNNVNAATNIIKSLYTMAHAAKDAFVRNLDLTRTAAQGRLRYVDFKLFDEEVSYTSRRGLPKLETFDIHKFQEIGNVSNTFVEVGKYSKYDDNDNEMSDSKAILRIRGILTMLKTAFQLSKYYAKQTCSKPCTVGYFKKIQDNQCCWDCLACGEFEVSSGNATLCNKCENGSAPNQNKSACISISVILHLPTDWTDGQNLICIGFSASSILLTATVLCVFAKYQNTPAVKSTTKELCYVIFAGIILVNVTLLISEVTQSFTTADVKVLPAIGFTMIYAALLVKTNRIARILVTPKHKFANMNLKYVSLKAQITITATLIGIEILICWFAVKFHDLGQSIGGSDFILKRYYLDGVFFIKIFAFVALLILFCTYYAIKTRNLPTNFNETKCIGFAMYATVITAAAFGLVYFASKKKILAMNLCGSINSLTILIFLFSPKLYIILWKPERNTKVYFSPIASSIRSYIGNKSRPNSRRSFSQRYSLENTGPQNVDDSKEHVQDSITNVIKELDDILDKGSKADVHYLKEEKIKGKVRGDHSELEDIWQKAYTEMFEKVKSCHNELNRVLKNYVHQQANQ